MCIYEVNVVAANQRLVDHKRNGNAWKLVSDFYHSETSELTSVYSVAYYRIDIIVWLSQTLST